jgi:hypothetical protein
MIIPAKPTATTTPGRRNWDANARPTRRHTRPRRLAGRTGRSLTGYPFPRVAGHDTYTPHRLGEPLRDLPGLEVQVLRMASPSERPAPGIGGTRASVIHRSPAFLVTAINLTAEGRTRPATT